LVGWFVRSLVRTAAIGCNLKYKAVGGVAGGWYCSRLAEVEHFSIYIMFSLSIAFLWQIKSYVILLIFRLMDHACIIAAVKYPVIFQLTKTKTKRKIFQKR